MVPSGVLDAPIDRSRLTRLAERAFFAACAAAWLATVLRGAGAPAGWSTSAALAAIALGLIAMLASPAGRVWLDGPRLALVAAGLLSLGSVYQAVGGDGYEYYALLRSPVLDGDLDFVDDFAGLGAKPVLSPRGEITSRVAMGVSLFWAPHFLLAHLLALAGLAPADGFGPLYQAAVTVASYVYAFAALLVIEGMLRRRTSRAVALLVVLAIWLATPLHFYMTANPSMSHGVSVFAATAMVWLWLRARETEDPRQWALVGVAGGLAALVRPPDAVLLAIPVLDLVLRRGAQVLRPLAGLLIPIALLGLAQLALARRAFVDIGLAVGHHGHDAGRAAEALGGVFQDRVRRFPDRFAHGRFLTSEMAARRGLRAQPPAEREIQPPISRRRPPEM